MEEARTVENPVLTPLNFDESKLLKTDGFESQFCSKQNFSSCILCEERFFNSDFKSLLWHLSNDHSVIVENFDNISLVPEYLDYWRNEFKTRDYKNVLVFNSQLKSYVMGEDVEEDKKIRTLLLNKKIQEIFDMQTSEWSNGHFIKKCFFCAKKIFTNQTDFFNHLNHFHHFMLGSQHNFVNLNGFLDIIEEKLRKLQCLYCEKFFKDYPAFKEHMRKKHHKRIRPSNSSYYHFFFDKHPELNKLKRLDGEEAADDDDEDEGEKEDDAEEDASATHHNAAAAAAAASGGEDDGGLIPVPMEQRLLSNERKKQCSDWTEEPGVQNVCLYCSFSSLEYSSVLRHMKETHCFDLEEAQKGLSFYQCIKLINFLRRQVYHHSCPVCLEEFPNSQDLQQHFCSTGHHSILPPTHLFDQFQYYFPTYEEDPLLSYIHTGVISDDLNVTTHSEPLPVLDECYLQSLSLNDQ